MKEELPEKEFPKIPEKVLKAFKEFMKEKETERRRIRQECFFYEIYKEILEESVWKMRIFKRTRF